MGEVQSVWRGRSGGKKGRRLEEANQQPTPLMSHLFSVTTTGTCKPIHIHKPNKSIYIMADEWSMFGSDDEESIDEPISSSSLLESEATSTGTGTGTGSTAASTLESCSLKLKASFEKTADAITTYTTQTFIKMNRGVPLNQRYFGSSMMACACEDGHVDVLSGILSKKIQQRGINLEALRGSSESEAGGEELALALPFAFDGAFIGRIFHYDGNNNGGTSACTCRLEPVESEIVSKHESCIRKKLALGGFLMVTMMIQSENENERGYNDWSAKDFLGQWKTLCSDGDGDDNGGETIFTSAVWDVENATIVHSDIDANANENSSKVYSLYTICITKRPCTVNTLSCVWKTNTKRVPSSFYDSDDEFTEETWIDYERRVLSNATIFQSVYEQREGLLTRESMDRAVKALQTHGFVILPGLFRHHPKQIETIQQWSNAVLKDFDGATDILKDKHNVDILNPGKGLDPLSYREMAMREDFRVDLRDGPHMREVRRVMELVDREALDGLGYRVMDGGEGTMPSIIDTKKEGEIEKANTSKADNHSLRFNPFVLDIIRKLQNPHTKESEDGPRPLYKGNFGRWNFSGSGPNGTPQPIRVGQIGSVISLPHAADQCIHADTPHIFETHDCLPCHYANLFILGEDKDGGAGVSSSDCDGNFTGDNLIGGTAFVDGSHRLSVTARLTGDNGISAAGADENTQNEMHMRIMRPSLKLGDAVIFDTRTLHFGLANRQRSERRPMLYVNMTHSWFFDPKNWDDKQSIFDE